jgi:hypothetical protein
VNQAWAGHPGRLVQGEGFEGKYVVVETCDSADKTQQGWGYDAASGAVKGPGGLCLDNRTDTYIGVSIPQPENGQMQLRPCDGAASRGRHCHLHAPHYNLYGEISSCASQ